MRGTSRARDEAIRLRQRPISSVSSRSAIRTDVPAPSSKFRISPESVTMEKVVTSSKSSLARCLRIFSTLSRRPAAVADPLRTSTRSTKRGKIFGLRHLLAKRQTQRLQPLIQRSNRVVAHRRNAAIAQIDGGQRLQHIVELRGREVDAEFLRPMNPGGVLEVAHAVFVKHNPLYLQARRRVGGGS